MPDIVSPAVRSRMMSGIRSRDTRPELLVRAVLRELGYTYRLHPPDLPGSPDLTVPRFKVAVFVHGCFWHQHAGCPYARLPKSRAEFWFQKLKGNVERDERAAAMLNMLGWRVILVWECATRTLAPERLRSDLDAIIVDGGPFAELSSMQLSGASGRAHPL